MFSASSRPSTWNATPMHDAAGDAVAKQGPPELPGLMAASIWMANKLLLQHTFCKANFGKLFFSKYLFFLSFDFFSLIGVRWKKHGNHIQILQRCPKSSNHPKKVFKHIDAEADLMLISLQRRKGQWLCWSTAMNGLRPAPRHVVTLHVYSTHHTNGDTGIVTTNGITNNRHFILKIW